MNQEILGGIYTLAAGVALYSVKEVIRFFVDTNLNRKQANLNNIYPIYSDVYKAAKIFIGSYARPILQPETLKYEDIQVLKQYEAQEEIINGYKEYIDFRYLINLSAHLEKMRDLKKEFNNLFSVNQFCFDEQFIRKTIDIDSVMDDDLNMLDQKIRYHMENGTTNVENNIINQSYKDKLVVYERYLNEFNKEFKKKFKI